MASSRREFLHQASGAALAGLVTKIPARRLWSMSVADAMPEPDEVFMRELALKAMDAARAAGADFADIRLLASRYFYVGAGGDRYDGYGPEMSMPLIGFPTRYGIRALVDGVWGFSGETAFTADGVTQSARTAVTVARANKARHRDRLELAPVAPAVTGMWATPMERDPLSIPLHEIGELALAGVQEAYKVAEVANARINMHWRRPTTVFASTDGTLIVQRLCFASPESFVSVSIRENGTPGWGSAQAEGLRVGPYGYEALGAERLIGGMGEATQRALEQARKKRMASPAEVGRYDVVFSAGTVASLVSSTIDAALNSESALSYLADGAGISFASPPSEMLGVYQIASPLVTLRADRTRPNGAATVGWDEEGVKPDAYTLIQDGVVTDYHTSRQTGAELGGWYRKRGEAVRSHGCMRGAGSNIPSIFTPNLTLEPAPGSARMEDLVSDVKKGLYVEHLQGSADHQMLNAQYKSESVRLIRNGVLGEYVDNLALQFITTSFWKSVDAIGGAASAVVMPAVTDGMAVMDPQQPFPYSTFSMVPLRARRVNVLNTGRTA